MSQSVVVTKNLLPALSVSCSFTCITTQLRPHLFQEAFLTQCPMSTQGEA